MALSPRIVGASGLVVAGAIAAVLVGQLPAVGVVDHVQVATPSSARQALVCPGPTIAVGASGTDANDLSASGRPSRLTGTAGKAEVTAKALKKGNVIGAGTTPRSLSAPAASGGAGAIAGAQLEQAVSGDAAGLAATACTAPQSDLWFAAGATTTGRTSVLMLANPSTVDAEVAIRLWTENGPVDQAASAEVTVPARSRRAVSLAGFAPSAGGVVVRVTSTGGRIGGALEQRTVRGLESGGLDVTGPTTAPARTQVVPGVRVAGAAAVAAAQREDDSADLQPVVRVLVPGRDAATVSIRVVPDGGGRAISLGRRVAAGVVTDFALNGLVDGSYTVRVTADRTFVAGARTSTVGDAGGSQTPDDTATPTGGADATAGFGSDAGLVGGDGPADAGSSAATDDAASSTSTARGIDLAWFAAAPVLTPSAAVAVVAAPSPLLTIANPGAARTVRITGPSPQTVQVPAKGSVAVPVTRGVVVLAGAEGMTAAVSYAGDDALAGYPVAAADQQAQGVRITP